MRSCKTVRHAVLGHTKRLQCRLTGELSKDAINRATMLKLAPSLTSMRLGKGSSSVAVEDIGALSVLTSLQQLDCAYAWVSSLASLSTLTKLRQLDCNNNTYLSSLTPLSTLTLLEWLDVSKTEVADLSALSNLLRLKTLRCTHTPVQDLAPLAALHRLVDIDFRACRQLT